MAEDFDVAEDILAAVKTAYTPYANKPSRYMVQPGTSAGAVFDIGALGDVCCPGSVIVTIGPKTFDDVANLRLGGWRQPYMVAVLRCAPSGTIQAGPTDTQFSDTAELLSDDQKLVRTTIRAWIDGQTDLDEADVLNWREVTIDPQGGCTGSSIEFDIPLMEDC